MGVGELKVLYYLKQRLTRNAYVSGGLARLSDRSTLNLKQRPRAGCAVDVHLALAIQGAPQKKLLQTDDAKEGLRAFAERRRPALPLRSQPRGRAHDPVLSGTRVEIEVTAFVPAR